MTDARRRRAESLFQQAADLAPEERPAFLEGEARGDPEVRTEVERLLECLSEPGIPALEIVEQDDKPELLGRWVGPYRVLELIGEGGFGSVYLAEQEKPLRRRVALKVTKLGMDTKQVIARFETERQALALMDHPNIARVLDAGATDTGRPYFVMELVRGVPITQYADEHKLSVRERLELFVQVCLAVQHAHQKGIIHRDLKPSNVLVALHDAAAVPVVIDFGIAKATDRRLTEQTCSTGFRQFIGTPEYMSPEQAEMGRVDVDTRTDVYSLGALLYELLTGRTPFDRETLRRAEYGELQRMIREEAPPTPSRGVSRLGSRLETVARARRVPRLALRRLIRGDLDWIVMKALEKDPGRRYDSAASLAADVRHHLNDEPVLAGPPSAFYRLRKFIRRHRVGVITSSLVAAAMLTGLALAVAGFLQATRARAELKGERDSAETNAMTARKEADKARAVTTFLQDMLASVTPGRGENRDLSYRLILDEAARKIDRGSLSGQPAVQAEVRATLGKAYALLGMDARAARHLRTAVTLFERVGCPDPERLVKLWTLETALLIRRGRLAEAERQVDVYGERTRRLLGREHTCTLDLLNLKPTLLWLQDRNAEAEEMQRALLAAHRRVLGDNDVRTHVTMNTLAIHLRKMGRMAEAEALLRQVLEIQSGVFGGEDIRTLRTLVNLANCLRRRGKLTTAERILRRVLRIENRSFGPEHRDTLMAHNNLALVLWQQGRLEPAERIFLRLEEIQRRVLGARNPETQRTTNNLLDLYRQQGRTEAVRDLMARTIDQHRRAAERPDAEPDAFDRYARLLLTCTPESLRNPEMALRVAERAAEKSARSDPRILQTLALARAACGALGRTTLAEKAAVAADPRERDQRGRHDEP